MALKILFIIPYPVEQAPSQRFRFEQYFYLLVEPDFKYATKPFLTLRGWQIIYKNDKISRLFFLFAGFLRRIKHLLSVPFYNVIFIHRETAPVGPPIFEWIISKVFRKKIIYDFDDAIWLDDPDERGSFLSKIKWKSKVASICKWSYKVSVGNEYLEDFARKYNNNVVINPTTIETENVHNPNLSRVERNELSNLSKQLGSEKKITSATPRDDSKKPVIGWTGTHSTLQYLNRIIPVIKKLERKYDFTFLVIANKNPLLNLKSFQFLPWHKESEIEDLMAIDIGIMPLSDDKWSKGKCGFKLLQYMALEKPVITSPVGVNVNIVEEDVNGCICHTEIEWYNKLEFLLTQPLIRKEFGERGRIKVVNLYSVLSNQDNFLSLFE